MKTHDIVFSFDTTGSMSPCIAQVRRVIKQTVAKLFKDIPFLRIGIIAHGDYIDRGNMIKVLELTNDQKAIQDFVDTVPNTHGGDAAECYEVVLNHARAFKWKAINRALVLIGDDVPHRSGTRHEAGGRVEYDWLDELRYLVKDHEVKVYPVQALHKDYADSFYSRLASVSGTPHLTLDQFDDMPDMFQALTYANAGQISQYNDERSKTPMSRGLRRTLDQLIAGPKSNRTKATGGKYEVIDVPKDVSIKLFVEVNGLEFETGRGFYEWTKSEIIQDYKEVLAQNLKTGAIIVGDRARSVLEIEVKNGRQRPTSKTHRGFVQSTSVNRKLIAGTKFLYEIQELAIA